MRQKCQDGFTLVELLICFSIIAILLLGAAQLTLYSLYVKRTSDSALESAMLASEKLEYLKSLPYESDELKESAATESIESRQRNDTFVRECRISDFSEDMKNIVVECYSLGSAHKKIRLLILCSQHLGF
jgi:prepilin-type N-terminal cleavage/methylation domain-containing protein